MAAIYKSYSLQPENKLDKLFHQPFKQCAKTIEVMDTIEKANTAAEIQPIIDYLYKQSAKYGDPDTPIIDQMSPQVFLLIMGKIKRWETILYWLYEIDILMEETALDELIREAEHRCEVSAADATRVRITNGVDENGISKKVRTTVKVRDDLATLHAERNARSCNTSEIMDLAKMLTSKYNK